MHVALRRIGIRGIDNRTKRAVLVINPANKRTMPLAGYVQSVTAGVALPQRYQTCMLPHPIEIRLLHANSVMHAAKMRATRVKLFGCQSCPPSGSYQV